MRTCLCACMRVCMRVYARACVLLWPGKLQAGGRVSGEWSDAQCNVSIRRHRVNHSDNHVTIM